MIKVFSKKIIVSFALAASFTTIFRSEVSLVDLKGLSTSLQEKYQEVSPALGALYWDAGYIQNFYRYGDPGSASVKLVKQLFNLNPDNITFDITRALGNVGTYFDARDIGKMVGYIFVYNQAYSQGKLEKEQQAELLVQLRNNIEINVLTPIKGKVRLSPSSMRNFRNPLVNSLLEEIGISDKPLYVKNNTIIMLLSFLWKKARTKDNFRLFFEGFYTAAGINAGGFFKNEGLLNQKYTEDDYSILKNKPYDQINELPLEDFVFLFLAKDIYDGIPLSDEISMEGGVEYKGNFFADCCETALRNFLNALLYKTKIKEFDVKLLKKLKAKQELIDFYTKYRTQEQINTHQAHNDWAQVVSGLPAVNYVGDKACEINAGISNMLKVINNLIPGITTFDKFADELKKYGITMGTKSSYPLDDQPYDANNTITFEIKKDVDPFSLTWKFQPNHSVVIYPLFQKDLFENYKKFFLDNVVQPNSFEQATYCALFACFERALGKVLTEIENKITEYRGIYEYQVLLLQTMKTPEGKIDVIELLKSKQILSTSQLEHSLQTFLFKVHSSLPIDRAIQGRFFEGILALQLKGIYPYIGEIFGKFLEKPNGKEVVVSAIEKILQSQNYSDPAHQESFKKLYVEIEKIIPEITGDYDKVGIIKAILFCGAYRNPAYQKSFEGLFAEIVKIVPTIKKEFDKSWIILKILQSDIYSDQAYQESFKKLYIWITEVVSTIVEDHNKIKIIKSVLLSKAYSDPEYQELFKRLYVEIGQVMPTLTEDYDKAKIVKSVLLSESYRNPEYQESFKELYAEIVKIIPRIMNDYDKGKIIKAILYCDAYLDSVYQESFEELYAAIVRVIPTIENNKNKKDIIERILQSKVYSDPGYKDSFKGLEEVIKEQD